MTSYQSPLNATSQIHSLSMFNYSNSQNIVKSSHTSNSSLDTTIHFDWIFPNSYENGTSRKTKAKRSGGHKTKTPVKIKENKGTKRKKDTVEDFKASFDEMNRVKEPKDAKVHKKVKIQNQNDRNLLNCLSPPTDVDEGNVKPQEIKKAVENIEEPVKIGETNFEAKKNKIKWRNLNVFYVENTNELRFKVDYKDESNNESKSQILTRNEMVQENPYFLLYFYENHLQFPKVPDFKPELLRKI